MHKAYMSEVVLFEVEVRNKLVKEMEERKVSLKELLNSVLREYFEIKKGVKNDNGRIKEAKRFEVGGFQG